jgi:hypothetical protein
MTSNEFSYRLGGGDASDRMEIGVDQVLALTEVFIARANGGDSGALQAFYNSLPAHHRRPKV